LEKTSSECILTKKWLRERQRDPYHRRAKEAGYRSRAIYKLFQISKKFHVIQNGDIVVDLGAYPGGWIQGARMLVGEEGFVLGIDRKPIDAFAASNVKTVIGDITQLTGLEIQQHLPQLADVVLSDLAPNISGIWEVDHARQIDLARSALTIARALLKRNGKFVLKAFQGDLFQAFLDEMKAWFRYVRVFRSIATRKRSAEVYIVALRFNPQGK
jgi:23S rRNA (uridine2552-2'-O)-methyltransferase